MKRAETINFQNFMDGSYTKKRKVTNVSLLSAVTVFSPSSIFNPPPAIEAAYIGMLAIGGLLVGVAVLERVLVIFGKQDIAKDISDFVKTILPWALIGGLILFVISNPLM
ncbi:hypothetical protein [Halalkalibacter urbisdiaboli]|uniref:hypothetical protein n=1 Tax=Halalkalibacter urbisdiaboli TaxID=1960589 RepID=UPI000B44D8F6|nr:hypothetical protein [Halalkalibacter urbisdiaboli]